MADQVAGVPAAAASNPQGFPATVSAENVSSAMILSEVRCHTPP